jgi:hypothetical protein
MRSFVSQATSHVSRHSTSVRRIAVPPIPAGPVGPGEPGGPAGPGGPGGLTLAAGGKHQPEQKQRPMHENLRFGFAEPSAMYLSSAMRPVRHLGTEKSDAKNEGFPALSHRDRRRRLPFVSAASVSALPGSMRPSSAKHGGQALSLRRDCQGSLRARDQGCRGAMHSRDRPPAARRCQLHGERKGPQRDHASEASENCGYAIFPCRCQTEKAGDPQMPAWAPQFSLDGENWLHRFSCASPGTIGRQGPNSAAIIVLGRLRFGIRRVEP